MPDRPPPENAPAEKKPPGGGRTSDHLANERTFLAWVRTCIAIISLGFVVAKFGLWLEEISRQTGGGGRGAPPMHERSSFIGAGMMVAGALLAPMAAQRFYRVGRDIEAGRAGPSYWLIVLLTGLILLLTAVLVGYLLLSMGKQQ